jgi:hypothetical protein
VVLIPCPLYRAWGTCFHRVGGTILGKCGMGGCGVKEGKEEVEVVEVMGL